MVESIGAAAGGTGRGTRTGGGTGASGVGVGESCRGAGPKDVRQFGRSGRLYGFPGSRRMYQDLSPAVERSAAAARVWAARLGAGSVRLVDWVLGLLDEDEGLPAELLARLGVDVARLRDELPARAAADQFLAPTDPALYAAARDHALRLRGDPGLTTDLVLLAVVAADVGFAAVLSPFGVRRSELETALHRPDVIALPAPSTAVFELPDLPDEHDAARIVDANLNRAREALRVLDDFARFGLGDAFLTGRLKALRHRLAEEAGTVPTNALLAARDTPGDVGTGITTPREYDRSSPRQVAEANFKRLQEALRSAEEYGKVLSPAFAREVEQIRYEAYTLERAVLSGDDARRKLADARLYVLLTGSQCAAALDWTIAEVAAGGADVVQLREKDLPDRELLRRARDVRTWTRKAGVLFIVNDRPDIARMVEADGVHLGQDDLPVRDARRIVGPDVLIGVSTHSIDQVRAAILDGADYLGVGPTFPSRTKAFDHFPGLEFVSTVAAETSLPAFVLGGISPETVSRAVAAGASRVAVGSAVTVTDDPRSVASLIRDAVEGRAPEIS
jgi:thiamine-phosphate pyrophosphorylase